MWQILDFLLYNYMTLTSEVISSNPAHGNLCDQLRFGLDYKLITANRDAKAQL